MLAALLKDIDILLIANKSDLAFDSLRPELQTYRKLGILCLEVACAPARGLTALRAALTGVTLLVGQSGVGKSSLVIALAPDAAAITAELTRDIEGRHTTTTARWYALDANSAIMDGPGVRDFAPPAHLVRAAERGFTEIHALSHQCRFNDCRHFEGAGLEGARRSRVAGNQRATLRELPSPCAIVRDACTALIGRTRFPPGSVYPLTRPLKPVAIKESIREYRSIVSGGEQDA